MEGVLLVPPDKGTIIGRAVWKSRYVVIGSSHREDLRSPATLSQAMTTSRIQASRGSTPKAPSNPGETVYLSIYKTKDDWEPTQQHPIYAIASCTIQALSHRKQGPVLPTLVLHIFPDPAADRQRKRRSSRPTPFASSRDTLPTTLWFRSANDRLSIYDWARHIQPFLQPHGSGQSPGSPLTPSSSLFTNPNPFANSQDAASAHPQSGPLRSNPQAALQHKASNQTQSSRERDKYKTYSQTPSLRSRRSDLSHMSSMNPGLVGFPIPPSGRPAELPSPSSTLDEYNGEFIEGWTSAQGRSSTLSSPSIPRDSFSSHQEHAIQQQQQQQQQQAAVNAGSPPGPRQTILDRAFQLGFIPGSEQDLPGAGKISSVAKFEAIARVKDGARRRTPTNGTGLEGLKSVWDPDDSDAESDAEIPHRRQVARMTIGEEEDDDDDDDDDREDEVGQGGEENQGDGEGGEDGRSDSSPRGEEEDLSGSAIIPPSARRALEFITGRRPSQQGLEKRAASGARSRDTRASARSTVVYDRDSMATLTNSGSSKMRPYTGYPQPKTAFAQRTYSQPHLAVLDVPAAPSSSSERTSEEGLLARRSSVRLAREQRQSVQSAKRLSFTDFTKRLSSTSSLLLVQTNTSVGGGSSSRGSGEVDPQQLLLPKGGGLQPRTGASQPVAVDREGDKRCGWRGSVGVFGAEGGFI